MPKPSDFRLRFGRAIRRQRDLRGLSREALAERADLSTRHIAALETGRSGTTMETLARVAAALDWNPLEAAEAVLYVRDLRSELDAILARVKAMTAILTAPAHGPDGRPARGPGGRPARGRATTGPATLRELKSQVDDLVERANGLTARFGPRAPASAPSSAAPPPSAAPGPSAAPAPSAAPPKTDPGTPVKASTGARTKARPKARRRPRTPARTKAR